MRILKVKLPSTPTITSYLVFIPGASHTWDIRSRGEAGQVWFWFKPAISRFFSGLLYSMSYQMPSVPQININEWKSWKLTTCWCGDIFFVYFSTDLFVLHSFNTTNKPLKTLVFSPFSIYYVFVSTRRWTNITKSQID